MRFLSTINLLFICGCGNDTGTTTNGGSSAKLSPPHGPKEPISDGDNNLIDNSTSAQTEDEEEEKEKEDKGGKSKGGDTSPGLGRTAAIQKTKSATSLPGGKSPRVMSRRDSTPLLNKRDEGLGIDFRETQFQGSIVDENRIVSTPTEPIPSSRPSLRPSVDPSAGPSAGPSARRPSVRRPSARPSVRPSGGIRRFASFVAPPSQPAWAGRGTSAEYYERFCLDGECGIPAIVPPMTVSPRVVVESNDVGRWITDVDGIRTSVGQSWDTFAGILANFFAVPDNLQAAKNDYMSFWLASKGPELMAIVMRDTGCGGGAGGNGGLDCFNLMTLATNIPVPGDRKARHVARDIGLENFCVTKQEALVTELRARGRDVSDRRTSRNLPVSARYLKSFTNGFSANWLAFCPNLIEASTPEIRRMVFKHGIFREKVHRASPSDILDMFVQSHRATMFVDAVDGFLGPDNVNQLLYSIGLAGFLGSENGIGIGVVVNWYESMSEQVFGPDGGLFESDEDSSKYVKLKPGLLETARSDGNGDEVVKKLRAAGRFYGHMIAIGRLVTADLSTMFYAKLLGKIIGFEALKTYETPALNRQYKWVHEDPNGAEARFVLIPTQINPTDDEDLAWPENQLDRDYALDLAATYYLYLSKPEYEEFTRGLFEVIPQTVFESGIKTGEFLGVVFGEMDINLDDMFQHLVLGGFTETDNVIVWIKSILRGWTQDRLRKFVHFVTGSSRVPPGGFAAYRNIGWRYPFEFVYQAGFRADLIPEGHNCFNQLYLGPYTSKEALERLLLVAFEHGGAFIEH